jgi:hypothetical protein
MGDFRIFIDGDDAHAVADELAILLGEGERSGIVSRSVILSGADETSKTPDPITLASLMLAIPAAAVAAVNIADRVRKRDKAQKLTVTATRLRRENRVTITVVGPDGTTWSLDRIEADTVLEIAEKFAEAP